MATENSYVIRPSYKQKFPVQVVKELIKTVLHEKLGDKKSYSTDTSKEIADEVKNKLKGLGLPRYKYMVQVVMGEQKGEGVRMGTRFFWDADTDKYASETFVNDHIFCVAVAFGVYLY